MPTLSEKTVVVGLSGGIACYKGAELIRALVKENARVRVIMTRGAREFITPLTLQTLCAHPVATDTFDLTQESEIGHIRLADSADVLLIAPATANLIAKLAHGIADDLLGTVALATRAPIVVAPAMNVNMFRNPAVQRNLTQLRELGMRIVEPDEGFLACGYEGEGRLASEAALLEGVKAALTPQTLAGERVLVTAGPTREAIDPVRFISNRSSGKMGFAVAASAWRRGASVVLVTGPTSIEAPPRVERISVTTAAEMRDAVLGREPWATVVVMAAAVADYRVANPARQKIKKASGALSLTLEQTSDILSEVGARRRPDRLLVGFAAETEHGIEHARRKLREKQLDLIVLNDVSQADAGFDVDTNRVWLIGAEGEAEGWPLLDKDEVAERLMDRVAAVRRPRAKTSAPTEPRIRRERVE
ncbi:MAG TPA: bifunctional phosphopantothenoylcysteine decarboxylase/phosphopantothenate--cysteine ligase CoaBC [Candidatus Binatia bacterium]|nr:bifunctional phosphopantothenoylcysteine decarboxylase/phosphopantothenate--cysteine ligase CoaBC [Candidatus Binatia bacterium]